jgi:hypothetical protein
VSAILSICLGVTTLLVQGGQPANPSARAVGGACHGGVGKALSLPRLTGGIQHLELAGNPLAEYPFFEYVRAFNVDAPVEIAIDTSRFPRLIGVTADLYVIAACSGPALQPQVPVVTFTFQAGPVTQNTVLVAAPGALSADAGTDIGVPYDVVIDANRNGVLDAGDHIDDGAADEAGFYVIHDLTQPGPLAVTGFDITLDLAGVGPGRGRLFFPTDIAHLGRLPLVLIGHGGGHEYWWYDYLQEHLASYGFISFSHENNVDGYFGGIPRVLRNTDALIEQQGTVGGGALAGHIDTRNIAFIGHSLGGEEVVISAHRLVTQAYVPTFFAPDAVKLMSSIAGTSAFEESDGGTPHGYNIHILLGSSDGEIGGLPDCEVCQAFRYMDRGTGIKQSTYVHGADHNDFNCCGWDDFVGPPGTEIGRAESQRVAKAVYLALLEHYLEGNVPAKDLLWRQWEHFKPIGVAPTTTVVSTFREGPETPKFVIDDYQTQPSTSISSSGGAITFTVTNVVEDLFTDRDFKFTWLPTDPMNGMTYGSKKDKTRGVVFEWTADAQMEFQIVPERRDFSAYRYLSFRACQGTRHPYTISEDADLVFDVTLGDANGTTSTINIGAYGGGLEEPYPRTGAGIGTGWQNELETIRIRLADFLAEGSHLDLRRIVAVILEFGPSSGASQGRIALDELEVTGD